MLLRMVVAMRLGISKQNVAIEAVELRGIGDPELAPRFEPLSVVSQKFPPTSGSGYVLTSRRRPW